MPSCTSWIRYFIYKFEKFAERFENWITIPFKSKFKSVSFELTDKALLGEKIDGLIDGDTFVPSEYQVELELSVGWFGTKYTFDRAC